MQLTDKIKSLLYKTNYVIADQPRRTSLISLAKESERASITPLSRYNVKLKHFIKYFCIFSLYKNRAHIGNCTQTQALEELDAVYYTIQALKGTTLVSRTLISVL